MAASKIQNFTDLVTWQEGHNLVVSIYKTTKAFPADEQFGLTSQIRRAAVSVTSNIAEGFSRATAADMAHFDVMALGSLTEIQNQLMIARDVSYISSKQFEELSAQSVKVQKLLHGLVRAARAGKGIREDSPDTKYKILDTLKGEQ